MNKLKLFFSQLFKKSREVTPRWDIICPETIKYSVVISGSASLLTFTGKIELSGESEELSWRYDLFNAHTDNPIQQTETTRNYGGNPMVIKSGGFILKPQPIPPWRIKDVREISLRGTIDGSPIAPYTLVIYFSDSKNSTRKKIINLVE